MRKRRFLIAAATAVLVALAGTGVAIAIAEERPQTDPVAATFSFAPVKAKQRLCTGQDGPYLEVQASYEGTIAGDPRLTGEVKVDAHHLLNLATGLGTSEGTFEVREPVGNKLKAHGTFWGVFTEGVNFHGFLLGRVNDEGHGPGEETLGDGELFAHFTSVVNPATGAVAGQLGGSGDPRTPAVIQSRHCTGPYTQVA